MALPRIVATDLDGTLLRTDGTVSARSRDALHAAHERGAEVLVVTGRPPRFLEGLRQMLGRDGIVACLNGALLYDLATGELLDHAPLDGAVAAELVVELRAALPGSVFACEHEMRFGIEPAYPLRFAPPPGTREGDMRELARDGVTKLILRNDEVEHGALVAAVAAIAGARAEVTHGGSTIVEISAPGVDKARGLRRLCATRGLDAADAVAFGDMPNDLPMLAIVGHAVAVANAHPAVIAIAHEVAPSNDDDGVASVVERLLAAAV